MSVLITVTLDPREDKAPELVRFASGILLETINSLGCIRAEIFSNLEESNEVKLLGEWDTFESYHDYLTRHTNKGDLDLLFSYLTCEPRMSWFSDQHDLVHQVKRASAHWQTLFNRGDASGCAALYHDTAKMILEPHDAFEGETFKGKESIESYLATLFEQGYGGLEYEEPFVYIVDAKSAYIACQYSMNKANGELIKQLWKLQADGSVLISLDNFRMDEIKS